MGSTKKRSFIKGLLWESFSLLLAMGLTFLWTKIVNYSTFNIVVGLSLFIFVIKLTFYFINERVWKQIKWGKN